MAMPRRRTVVFATAAVLVAFIVLAAAAAVMVTRTTWGREHIRRLAQQQIERRLGDRGTVRLGTLRGSLLTGLTLDSLIILDDEDSLFMSAGPIKLVYDPRDLLDRRLLIGHVRIENAVVNFRRHADGSWNYRRIFPSGPPSPARIERKFGDYIVLDSVDLVNARVRLTQPWEPADSLRGARRDSAIRHALRTPCPEGWEAHDWLGDPCGSDVRNTSEGLKRTYHWIVRSASLGRTRLADPDSSGRSFAVRSLNVDEPNPPFAFRNVQGPINWKGDTIWFRVPHWELPRSSGSARGRIHWGPGPMQYDIDVAGDSVALADINWVYPTLPLSGGGNMLLHIENEPEDPSVLDYAITKMDVRSTASHLTGDMTFGVGAPVLIVKDLALQADPVDFRLIETLNGEPLPVPWAGQITGNVRARGGPVTRFMVDDARFAFRDAHVAGAVTRGNARGGLNILSPSRTVFRGFGIDLQTLDLRTIRYLYPGFARLGGTISGSATLDSSWLDVRFHDADIAHTDGDGFPTRATGSGRVTYGDKLHYDANLELAPASMTMLSRSYPIIPLRGRYSGPLVVRGVLDSLALETTLRGEAGEISYSGWVDGDSAGGYASHGVLRLRDGDLRGLTHREALPHTLLNGTFATDLRFDSLANMTGTVGAALSRSMLDSLRVFSSGALLRFGNGRMMVDSLRLETTAALISANGGLGLVPSVRDSLQISVVADSLGGFRPYLDPGRQYGDSLALALGGFVRVDAALTGSVDSLGARGSVNGTNLVIGDVRADRLLGSFDFADVNSNSYGTLALALDRPRVGGVRLTSTNAELVALDSAHWRAKLDAVSETGPALAARMNIARSANTTRLSIDSLALDAGERVWALQRPAHVAIDSTGLRVDTLLLRQNGEGRILVAGSVPMRGPIAMQAQVDSLALEDVAAVLQSRTPLGGWLSFSLDARGTRDSPQFGVRAAATDMRVGSALNLPRASLHGSYSDKRATGEMRLLREGKPVVSITSELPLDLRIAPVENRLLEQPLSARIEAANVDLSLLQAMAPSVFTNVSGTMSTEVNIAGTWQRPTLDGAFTVNNGVLGITPLGVTYRDVTADIGLSRDSIRVKELRAVSGERNGTASLTGLIGLDSESISDLDGLRFDLRFMARDFQLIRQRRLADLEVSGNLHLTDRSTDARLTGDMTIERGTLYLQDQPAKELVALDDPDFRSVVNVEELESRGVLRSRTVLDKLVENLHVDNLSIGIGDEVWLRSSAANVKLGGSVDVLRTGDQLALSGSLVANRGEYRLDLGLVQRRFDVTRGNVTFYGEPGINPALDISAIYTVRQVDRPDVRIRADIGGTLRDPRLTLSSDERIAISTTEILSYLVFGAPSFALGQDNTAALRPVAAALLPTLGTFAERELAQEIGFFDLFQIQAPALGRQNVGSLDQARDFLSGSRIGVGKQIGERTFITANAGLCGLAGRSGRNTTFTESLGVTIEHRLDERTTVQAGVEPAVSALLCNRGGAIDINTPRQWGFDLFREWNF